MSTENCMPPTLHTHTLLAPPLMAKIQNHFSHVTVEIQILHQECLHFCKGAWSLVGEYVEQQSAAQKTSRSSRFSGVGCDWGGGSSGGGEGTLSQWKFSCQNWPQDCRHPQVCPQILLAHLPNIESMRRVCVSVCSLPFLLYLPFCCIVYLTWM